MQIAPDLSADQVVESLLSRLAEKSSLAGEIRRKMEEIPPANWIATEGVTRIADAGLPVLFPPTCLIAQIAYRQDNEIFYDNNLYQRMDSLNQGSLILHEMLYALAKDLGAKDASRVYPVLSRIVRSDAELKRIDNTLYTQQLLSLSENPTFLLDANVTITIGTRQLVRGRRVVTQDGVKSIYLNEFVYTSMDGVSVNIPPGAEVSTGEIYTPGIETMIPVAIKAPSSREPIQLIIGGLGFNISRLDYIGDHLLDATIIGTQWYGDCVVGHNRVRVCGIDDSHVWMSGEKLIMGHPQHSSFKSERGTINWNAQLSSVVINKDGDIESGTLAQPAWSHHMKRLPVLSTVEFDRKGHMRKAKASS